MNYKHSDFISDLDGMIEFAGNNFDHLTKIKNIGSKFNKTELLETCNVNINT